MHLPRSVCYLYLATGLRGFAALAETPSYQPDDTGVIHIAIVGAGVAGASTAYNLHRLSASSIEHSRKLKITVYESSPIIGGQVRTISPPGTENTLESGAPYFFPDDWCLSDTAQSLGLGQQAAPQSAGTMVWNGYRLRKDRFCFDDGARKVTSHSWNSIASNVLQEIKQFITKNLASGNSERESGAIASGFRSEITVMQEKLKSLGRSDVFDSLHEELNRVGLGDTIKSSAQQFLNAFALPDSFQTSVVEPCIDALFGLNIEEATGLHVVASIGRSRPTTIVTGNDKLVTRMLHESGAKLRLDSQVTKIETGDRQRFSLTIESTNSKKQTREEHDVVILTGNSIHRLRSEPLPKAHQSYVTHFSTAYPLNPETFGVKLGWNPSTLLTTDNSSYLDNETRILRLTTFPEFYIDRSDCHWDDECDQFLNVHRVDSTAPISETKLRSMAEGINTQESNPLMWIHTQSWDNRAPIINSTGFDTVGHKIEPEPNMLNANSDLINTMEMSCRMGRNAALKLLQTRILPNGLPQYQQLAGFT
ncbi:hypothetical protein GGR51DRAFT_542111 [Nemania sp. FL0031]|nr:hypothetical protein GGR51DRAFT_542111 [Nemania sp. FL0031]